MFNFREIAALKERVKQLENRNEELEFTLKNSNRFNDKVLQALRVTFNIHYKAVTDQLVAEDGKIANL